MYYIIIRRLRKSINLKITVDRINFLGKIISLYNKNEKKVRTF